MMKELDPTPARPPERITIPGRDATLVPLDATAHAAALADLVCGQEKASLWNYLPEGPFDDRDQLIEVIRRKAASDDPLFYAIIDQRSGTPAGYAALMRIEPRHRVIEVGHILFAHPFQRTRGATEVIYLLARYIFEELGYRRFEWKCDSRNEPSRRAAVRFGFTYEGTFRQHMIIKGRNRDTAWYAMLDSEWPERKARFESWLSPENFDERGVQRQRLGDVIEHG